MPSLRAASAVPVRLERCSGQDGTETVVQLAVQPAPLLSGRGDEPGPGRLQLFGQHGGVQRDRQRIRQQLEHRPFRGRQPSFAPACAGNELADPLTAVHERYHVLRAGRLSAGDDPLRPGIEGGVRQPQCIPQPVQHPAEILGRQALPDRRHRPDRVVPDAVQRPIDQLLKPDPNGVERERDGDRGQHGRTTSAQGAVEQCHQRDVRANHCARQQHVEQRAGDDEPNIEQAVPQDRDRHRDRDEREGHDENELRTRVEREHPWQVHRNGEQHRE